jgi:hypothetical protein
VSPRQKMRALEDAGQPVEAVANIVAVAIAINPAPLSEPPERIQSHIMIAFWLRHSLQTAGSRQRRGKAGPKSAEI